MMGQNHKNTNPYEVLGLSPSAQKSEIKAAYRKLVMKYHPDHGGDEEKFKKINEAYSVLSDDKKKAEFDMMRSGGSPGHDFFSGFNPFNFSGPFHEIFRRENKQKSRNIIFNLEISLEEIKKGSVKIANYKRNVSCDPCAGTGGEGKQTCSVCDGGGFVLRQPAPNVVQQTTCRNCGGFGFTFFKKCKSCHGQGLMTKKETIKFKIEKIENDT